MKVIFRNNIALDKKNIILLFFWGVGDWRKGREKKNKIICFVDKLVWNYINWCKEKKENIVGGKYFLNRKMFLEKENNNIYLHNQFIWRQKINVFVYSAPIFCEIVFKKMVKTQKFWYFYKLNVKRLKSFKHLI